MSPHRFTPFDSERVARPGALLVVAMAVAALCAIACNDDAGSASADSDVDSDGDSDADTDTDADSGADAGGEWLCPEPPTAICDVTEGGFGAYELSAAAADLGEGTAFVDAENYRVLLAERPDGTGGTEPILVVGEWGAEPEYAPGDYEIVTLGASPVEPLRAVDLVADECPFNPDYGFLGYDMIIGYPAVVLLCGESGCALYAMMVDDPDTAWLEPIPNGEVPIAETHGLVHVVADLYEELPTDPVCAFGDGLSCFDGTTWTTVLASGGPILLAATTFREDWTTYLLASGASCRLVRQGADGFEEIPLGCDIDLKTLSGGYESFAAGGDGLLVLGFPEVALECPLDGSDFVLVRATSDPDSDVGEHHRLVTAFTQDGSVIEVHYDGYARSTCAFAVPFDGAARAGTNVSPGADFYGSMVLTATSAYWRGEFGGPPLD